VFPVKRDIGPRPDQDSPKPTSDAAGVVPAAEQPPWTLERIDREIIEVLLCWTPYGDPPDDDVAIRFGMTLKQVKGHVARLVDRGARNAIHPYDRTLLVRVAKQLGCALQTTAPVHEVGRSCAEPLNLFSPGISHRIPARMKVLR
jgi:hypothetical protein